MAFRFDYMLTENYCKFLFFQYSAHTTWLSTQLMYKTPRGRLCTRHLELVCEAQHICQVKDAGKLFAHLALMKILRHLLSSVGCSDYWLWCRADQFDVSLYMIISTSSRKCDPWHAKFTDRNVICSSIFFPRLNILSIRIFFCLNSELADTTLIGAQLVEANICHQWKMANICHYWKPSIMVFPRGYSHNMRSPFYIQVSILRGAVMIAQV